LQVQQEGSLPELPMMWAETGAVNAAVLRRIAGHRGVSWLAMLNR
jgi:hypothetical protein